MAVSEQNKNITIKVSNIVYEYLKAFSKKFGVSMSSTAQHFITLYILELDEVLESSPARLYELVDDIKNLYDLRRK